MSCADRVKKKIKLCKIQCGLRPLFSLIFQKFSSKKILKIFKFLVYFEDELNFFFIYYLTFRSSLRKKKVFSKIQITVTMTTGKNSKHCVIKPCNTVLVLYILFSLIARLCCFIHTRGSIQERGILMFYYCTINESAYTHTIIK